MKPKNAGEYNSRAYAYLALEDYVSAADDLRKAIELKPDFANPYKHYGTILRIRGDYEAAVDYYSRAIELDPKYKKHMWNVQQYTIYWERKKRQKRMSRLRHHFHRNEEL